MADEKKFYINYRNTPFLETSKTAAYLNRLNWRCEILLTRNQKIIENKKILDLASHDGRFSYACLKLGAKYVTGIEGRSYLVNAANANLIKLGCNPQNFNFIHGDIFDYLSKFKLFEFDTILCFGFFYHTVQQIELLREIKRIEPESFLLDSNIIKIPFPVKYFFRLANLMERIEFRKRAPNNKIIRERRKPAIAERTYLLFHSEDHKKESATIDAKDISATPTKEFIEMMLKSYGFNFTQLYWSKKEIKDWRYLEDYKSGKRVSYISQLIRR